MLTDSQNAYSQVNWSYTNESLDSITKALDARVGDVVHAVCGSGDQLLALARNGASVIGLDTNVRQIHYAASRFAKYERGDFFDLKNRIFCNYSDVLENAQSWRNFFTDVEWTSEATQRITLKRGSIFAEPSQSANKFYFSNAFGYRGVSHYGFRELASFVEKIPSKSQLYFADGLLTLGVLFVDEIAKARSEFGERFDISQDTLEKLQTLYLLDKQTTISVEFESRWGPIVLEKK